MLKNDIITAARLTAEKNAEKRQTPPFFVTVTAGESPRCENFTHHPNNQNHTTIT